MSLADDEKAAKLVIQVLTDPAVKNLNFVVGKWAIRTGFYDNVSTAIKNNQITVVVEPSLLKPGAAAQYKPEIDLGGGKKAYDVIVLPRATLGDTLDQQIKMAGYIIHECTHAGIDMLNLKPMTRLENELIAHIAHFSALWGKIVQQRMNPKTAVHVGKIEKAAWLVAEQVFAGKTISKFSLVVLSVTILVDPLYETGMFLESNNDGVGKPWLGMIHPLRQR